MKNSLYLALLFGITLYSCKNLDVQQDSEAEIAEIDPIPTISDFNEIEVLIREMYIWHERNQPSEIGMIIEDSLYMGFNLDDLATILKELRESGFFTQTFIRNYNAMHQEINEKLKNGEILWYVGNLPPFGNGSHPWCNCQDVPFDEPNPWSLIEIGTINVGSANRGKFYWKWGKLPEISELSWSSFKYHFTVEKVDGKWKIDSLEGINAMFD